MCEVTITQATAELPMLVKKLQTGEESVVYIKCQKILINGIKI
ncbi:MAG: hypothetical protein E7J29_09490 [Veillonella sp.]|nr:hypothetical protein [Veillonella sp.]